MKRQTRANFSGISRKIRIEEVTVPVMNESFKLYDELENGYQIVDIQEVENMLRVWVRKVAYTKDQQEAQKLMYEIPAKFAISRYTL